MNLRSIALGIGVVLSAAALAIAQTPTDSNVGFTTFARSRGTPCTSPGTVGCGGCYPAVLPGADITGELSKVNPEWQPIGPMIDVGAGVPADSNKPPFSAPMRIKGSVLLSKINEGGDFPGSHLTDDQNTFIQLDSDFINRLATGNSFTGTSCPGEGCGFLEMEREIGKYPLFAWAGTGDRVEAIGRWIFDCGHPDPDPGHCSATACATTTTETCLVDSECPSGQTCCGGVGQCTGNSARCIADKDCGVCDMTPPTTNVCTTNSNGAGSCTTNANCGTCTNPMPNFNVRAEMHPAQALVVLRDKGLSATVRGTRADVFLSGDAGGAGDECTVKRLTDDGDVLFYKACFINQCSLSGRSCKTNKDCSSKEVCINFNPDPPVSTKPLADVNAPDFNQCSSTPRHCEPPCPGGETCVAASKHCSVTIQQPCEPLDCPLGETCEQKDNFEFEIPLPPHAAVPVGANPNLLLKKTITNQRPVGVSGKEVLGTAYQKGNCSVSTTETCTVDSDCPPTEVCVLNDWFLPVSIDMTKRPTKKGNCSLTTAETCKSDSDCPTTEVCEGGVLPNVFAKSFKVGWKDDTTPLKKVTVKFKTLTINNPLKERVPAIAKQCSNPGPSRLSGVPCNSDADCTAGTCSSNSKPCHSDKDCKVKTDICQASVGIMPARCMGGVTPGWEVFGQVNGDWIQFKKLEKVGSEGVFPAPPYTVPSTALKVAEAFTFTEYVPASGEIHIATSGHSLNCLDTMYGNNVVQVLDQYGLDGGSTCLLAGDLNTGRVDIIHDDLTLATAPPGVTCVPGKVAGSKTCTVRSGKGDGGHCSATTTQLCTSDADCPGTCGGTTQPSSRPCAANSDCKHCANDASRWCASGADCGTGICSITTTRLCRKITDCPSGETCVGAPAATCALNPGTPCSSDIDCLLSLGDSCALCVADASPTCTGAQTCEPGICSNDSSVTCTVDANCGVGNTCVFGGAFTLTYDIQVK